MASRQSCSPWQASHQLSVHLPIASVLPALAAQERERESQGGAGAGESAWANLHQIGAGSDHTCLSLRSSDERIGRRDRGPYTFDLA
eukprot:3360703-Pleurochrysis_carterae.AAC.3